MAKRDRALGVSDIKVSAVTLERVVDGLPVDVREPSGQTILHQDAGHIRSPSQIASKAVTGTNHGLE